MLIRRMTLSDAARVHEIELATFTSPWSLDSFEKEMTENKCARYLVCEEGGRVIAYAGAWIVLDEGHVTNIAVERCARGRGVGRRLTLELMRYASNLGVSYMTLEVRKSNLIAQGMYAGLGFVSLGARKRYYEDNGEDALLMVCQSMPPADEDFSEEGYAVEF